MNSFHLHIIHTTSTATDDRLKVVHSVQLDCLDIVLIHFKLCKKGKR